MPHHTRKTAAGTITHIFGHRFVMRTEASDLLADLTPHGADRISLHLGDQVTIEGEAKPTEIKVDRLTRGGKPISIDHPHPHNGPHHHPHHEDADPAAAVAAARAAGFVVLGQPRRKPKHFEVLGKRDGTLSELHIEFDGYIRKSKPVNGDDPKWSNHLGQK